MGLFNYLAREMMRQQTHKNRRRRHSGWGFGPPPRRRSRYYSPYPVRRHRRSNTRVVGCCLPIPIGVMTLGVALRSLVGRGR